MCFLLWYTWICGKIKRVNKLEFDKGGGCVKKLIALVLASVCVLSLVGCSQKRQDEDIVGSKKSEQYVDPNGLGIEMTLQPVSATSAMIVFTLHSDNESDEAWTGAAYWLEKEENGSWERVFAITDDIKYIPYADTYAIKSNVKTEIPVDWSYLYGELEHGKYRIGKEVLGKGESEHSSWYTYYAEFEIVNITC